MKKFLAIVLSVFMMIGASASLTACNENSNPPETVTITDMEGTKVTIPTDVDKVACISPSASGVAKYWLSVAVGGMASRKSAGG